MSSRYRIVPFSSEALPNVKHLSDLHVQLLPKSPIVKLGRRFMEDFYYSVLPCEGRIFGAVAYVDDAPAGFVSATCDSAHFMADVMRKHWFAILRTLFFSLPSRKCIGGAWESWRVMATRNRPRDGDQTEAEILSIGVLPQYRDRKFVRETGLRIANSLMDYALKKMLAEHPALVRAIVDTDNAPARFFYYGNGWKLENEHIPGWRTASVEFVWRPGDEEGGRAVAPPVGGIV